MSQNYDPTLPASGVTTFGELYAVLRNKSEALRSFFEGTSFPANPLVGQGCYRSDLKKFFIYTGDATLGVNGWVEIFIEITGHGLDVVTAAGSKNSLTERLAVALNDDGTLKSTVTAYQSEWITPTLTFTYSSSNSFIVSGDQTDTYVKDRRVKINHTTSATTYSRVTSSIYNTSGITTVYIYDDVISTDLTNVSYSILTGDRSKYSIPKNVLPYELLKDYNNDLAAAVTAIGTSKARIVIADAISVDDLTIPENISLEILDTAKITVNTKNETTEIIGTGTTANTTHYTYTLTSNPIAYNTTITVAWTSGGNTYSAFITDFSNINSAGVTGTIDRYSGDLVLDFNTAFIPDAGTNITCTYTPACVLTINGGIEAGLYQIFNGDGWVLGSPKIEAVYPEWFGANYIIDDNSISLQKSINFYSSIFFSNIYNLSNPIYVSNSKVIIKGKNINSSGLNASSAFTNAILQLKGTTTDPINYIKLSNFYIKGRDSLLTGQHGLFIENQNGLLNIDNVKISNCGDTGLYINGYCFYTHITNSEINNNYGDYNIKLLRNPNSLLHTNICIIDGNTSIHGGNGGIYAEYTDNLTIRNCGFEIISGVNPEIYVYKGTNINILENYFERSTSGTAPIITCTGDSTRLSDGVNINNNIISTSSDIIHDQILVDYAKYINLIGNAHIVSSSSINGIHLTVNSKYINIFSKISPATLLNDGAQGINLAEDGIMTLLPSATTATSLRTKYSADTYPRFWLLNTGECRWGNGEAVYDVNLYRYGVGKLAVDGGIVVKKVLSDIITFPDGATTPDVSGGKTFKTANTAATSISTFTGGDSQSQEITVIFTDANTTIVHNAGTVVAYPILLKGGVNVTPAANTTMKFVFDGTYWYEV